MLAPNTLTIPSSTGCFSRAVPYRWGGRKNFALRCRPILRLGAALLHLHRIALPKQQNHKKDVKVFFHFAPFRTQPDGKTRGNITPTRWMEIKMLQIERESGKVQEDLPFTGSLFRYFVYGAWWSARPKSLTAFITGPPEECRRAYQLCVI